MTYNTENPETVTVKTWIARRTGGVFDGTVWVPEGGTVGGREGLTLRPYGAPVTRPGLKSLTVRLALRRVRPRERPISAKNNVLLVDKG